MALFNVNIGSGGQSHRPVVRPGGVHWTLLALAPVSLLAASLGSFGFALLGLAVWVAFFYACWIIGRWVFLSAGRLAGQASRGMGQSYAAPPHHPPNPYPPYGYPPPQQSYAPPPPPPNAYEQPPHGYAPHGEGQRYER